MVRRRFCFWIFGDFATHKNVAVRQNLGRVVVRPIVNLVQQITQRRARIKKRAYLRRMVLGKKRRSRRKR